MLAVSGELDGEPGTSESGEFLYGAAEDISAMIRPNRVAADDEYYDVQETIGLSTSCSEYAPGRVVTI